MNIPETTDPSTKPIAQLEGEHRVIQRVLAVLEILVERANQNKGFETESFTAAVEFFRLFADACHHAKEEDLLFPILAARGIPKEGGPIGVMLEEHRLARGYTHEMEDALGELDTKGSEAEEIFLRAAVNYLELLTNHIFKEDNVLFKMGEGVLSSSDQDNLNIGFCDVSCRSFSGKTREQLESIADRLEDRWVSS